MRRIFLLSLVALTFPALTAAAQSAATPAAEPKARIGFLLSGHSLTDKPIDTFTQQIAESLGHETGFVRHNSPGSPIIARTIGHRDDPREPARFPWRGYSTNAEANGRPVDLIRELRKPTVFGPGKPFTQVIIAERHDSLGPLEWEQTVPLLRHFYELSREGSPGVKGYFYTTWIGLTGPGSSRQNPAGWVRFEREQLKLWESIVSRINDSLANEKRTDRMTTLPASGALAELVDRATTKTVPGVTGRSVTETMDKLFTDDVHVSDLGKYYLGCVIYSSITRQSPVGAAYPPEVSKDAARSLQALAWEYTSAYYRGKPNGPQHTVAERLAIGTSFGPIFWTYHKRPEQGAGAARFFSQTSLKNPLWTSPGADESKFWLPRLP